MTITANDEIMPYGGPVPPLAVSYSGFVNGDTSVATPPTVTTAATITSPPGTYSITASGAADPNYWITYVPGTLTVSPQTPVPGVNHWGTTAGQSLVVLVAKMLPGATSPNGGALSITAVNSPSTQGGTVTLDPTGVTVTYAPPASPPTPPGTYPYTDQFTYTLFDTFAGATGTVSVTVISADQQSKNGLGTIAMNGGNPVIGFLGIPGVSYNVQWTASLAVPITWTTLATVIADPTGFISATDMTAPMPDARFYRTVPAQ